MKADLSKTTCIACSIFRSELCALQARGELSDLSVRYLPSMLHLDPEKLDRRLGDLLEEEGQRAGNVLILYGDCHPDMHRQETLPGVVRIGGVNCPEILLGKERYRTLIREGCFFLMPEWTVRWRDIFQDEMGLTDEVAPDFMGELHTRLVYLDTGIIPLPEEQLQALSEFTGLAWDVISVKPDNLLAAIESALDELKNEN